MTHLRKFKSPSLLKWVSSNLSENYSRLSFPSLFSSPGAIHTANTRTNGGSRALQTERSRIEDESSMPDCETVAKVSRSGRTEAQAALLDYLHCTRGMLFTDAEHMSKNSPTFLEKLLKRVENEQEIGRSLTRFLRYHPINEFEPFFESLGLKPSEFNPLLPQDLMFLSDDDDLVENYHVLCNYGIPRHKIGNIYREVFEVFRYKPGVLRSKLQAYEDSGLSRSAVIKFVASSPRLLIGDANCEFFNVLEDLKCLGFQHDWIEGRLSDRNSYNWSHMLGLLHFFGEMGYKEQLGNLFTRSPEFLFEASGNKAFSLIGLILKLGMKMNEISSVFQQFPRIQVGTFLKNLRAGLAFLVEIEMEGEEILQLVHAHPLLLGSFTLKKPNTVLAKLNCGKKRVRGILKEDPEHLRKWVLGSRIDPLPNPGVSQRSLMKKTEFLLNLGFRDNSEEMKKALKLFRGKGAELQERFNLFLKAGLDKKDVSQMIKIAPNVLNQSMDVLDMKIDFLVNELRYPISSLMVFPQYLCYTIPRVKFRFSVYNWLKDEGLVRSLALSTVLATADKYFMSNYVNHHPKGLEVWEKFKKESYSS
ncbi:transcription termination factor MTEF18, mitochondrial-like isoform X2 [Telopea speciosissima]|uniref:transcription termination factor MTEF18, mitochondrial-like isoform X2 n=1 Tax=Telopea speciosissima TaxID=54955 RepID=UPI001CC7A0C1|nr:transcription termination factor MTEF18, mitochondrial-like isoform X2 [Telopea speciosissima]